MGADGLDEWQNYPRPNLCALFLLWFLLFFFFLFTNAAFGWYFCFDYCKQCHEFCKIDKYVTCRHAIMQWNEKRS